MNCFKNDPALQEFISVLLFGVALVIIWRIRLTVCEWVCRIFRTGLAFLKQLLCKVMHKILVGWRFVTNRKIILALLIANLIFLVNHIALYFHRKTILWSIAFGFPLFSIISAVAYYADDFWEWCRTKHPAADKIGTICNNILFCVAPIHFFGIGLKLTTIYFLGTVEHYMFGAYLLLFIGELVFVLWHCVELVDITNTKYALKTRITLALHRIIHIIQLFANLYLILLILDPTALTGMVTDSGFSLYFDLTYFSAMTFLAGGCSILPVSIVAKALVLIESFVFVIGISVIVLGMIAPEVDRKSSSEISTKDLEKIKSLLEDVINSERK